MSTHLMCTNGMSHCSMCAPLVCKFDWSCLVSPNFNCRLNIPIYPCRESVIYTPTTKSYKQQL